MFTIAHKFLLPWGFDDGGILFPRRCCRRLIRHTYQITPIIFLGYR